MVGVARAREHTPREEGGRHTPLTRVPLPRRALHDTQYALCWGDEAPSFHSKLNQTSLLENGISRDKAKKRHSRLNQPTRTAERANRPLKHAPHSPDARLPDGTRAGLHAARGPHLFAEPDRFARGSRDDRERCER